MLTKWTGTYRGEFREEDVRLETMRGPGGYVGFSVPGRD